MFQLAERLGMTVNQLLTGVPGPLSYRELVEWIAFTEVHNAKENAQIERAKRGS